jgi:hypothetical protein
MHNDFLAKRQPVPKIGRCLEIIQLGDNLFLAFFTFRFMRSLAELFDLAKPVYGSVCRGLTCEQADQRQVLIGGFMPSLF